MRLIDADALSMVMYDEAFENDESYNETNPMARWDSGLWIRYKMFENILKEAPTIEPKQEWIPCSERLPEEGTAIIVQYGDEEISAIKSCRPKYFKMAIDRFSVIAWMPLPEPWKGADDES